MSQNVKKEVTSSNKKRVVDTKKIPLKNYVYAFLVLLGGILIVLYIFEWINVKKEEKLMNSYLITSSTINSKIEDFDSLKQILNETSSSYFIYLSYTGNEDVYKFEQELKKVIDNYGLNDNFYYMDLTKIMNDNENYLELVNNNLNINIDRVPVIIYVKDGKIEDNNILDGINGTMLKVADLENLLDIYDYELIK